MEVTLAVQHEFLLYFYFGDFLRRRYISFTVILKSSMAKKFLLNFSMKVLEKLLLCETILHVKSYGNILNGNQDIDDLRFLVFLTVQGYLMVWGDANLLVHNLVHKESKCVWNF